MGGILSHIVIAIVLGHPDAETALNVAVYKDVSAYILILPGLSLKIVCDLLLLYFYATTPNWLKVKLLVTAFLAINAFFFLVPMMPELVQLARDSLPAGEVSPAFLEREHTEMLIGQLNVLPLLIELVMGSFRPKLFGERKAV